MSRRRKPQRLTRAFDRYRIKTGSAGFVILIKNDKRIMPKNFEMRFNVRRPKAGDA